jgi:hypothetical protein
MKTSFPQAIQALFSRWYVQAGIISSLVGCFWALLCLTTEWDFRDSMRELNLDWHILDVPLGGELFDRYNELKTLSFLCGAIPKLAVFPALGVVCFGLGLDIAVKRISIYVRKHK